MPNPVRKQHIHSGIHTYIVYFMFLSIKPLVLLLKIQNLHLEMVTRHDICTNTHISCLYMVSNAVFAIKIHTSDANTENLSFPGEGDVTC